MEIELAWEGEHPDGIDDLVRADLRGNFYEGGECVIKGGPGGLLFHHVFLGEDMEGPAVFVFGKESDPGKFYCEYTPKLEWTDIPKGAAHEA
jgi:hypothetical protein